MEYQQIRRSQKSPLSSRISKLRSEKLFKRVVSPTNNTKPVQFHDDQISAQIAKQIVEIKAVLRKFQPQIVKIQEKNSQKSIYQQIIDIEQKIKRKDFLLSLITQESRFLKQRSSNPRLKQKQVELLVHGPKDQKQKLFKLAEQLKDQRLQLIKVQQQQIHKRQNLIKIKNSIKNLQQKYIEKCRQTKQKPVTYMVFKELNEQKKKQLQDLKSKKKGRQTIKDIQFNTELTKITRVTKAAKNTNLKQVLNRKHIADQALLNARKKHNNQINELQAKVQFLRDEDSLLAHTIRQKQVQLINLQDKFNESKKKRGIQKHQRIKRLVLHQKPKFNNFLPM